MKKFALYFSIALYLLGALLALGLPEYFIPTSYWYVRRHVDFVPQWFPTRLLILWCFMSVPWLIVAYRQKRHIPNFAVFLPIILASSFAIWVKPPQTHDLYVYLAQGRQLLLGINPYKVKLWDCIFDPVIASISKTWFDQLSLYGPLIILLGAAANLIGPNGSLIGLGRTLKSFWILPYGLWARMSWAHWKKNPDRNLIFLAIFANPVLIFQVFVEGHADLAMVGFICVTGLLLLRSQPLWSGLTLTIAACIKMTSLVVFPACACWLFHKNRRQAAEFTVTFLGLYALSHAFIGGGEWSNVTQFNKNWSDLSIAGIVPRLLLFIGIRDGNAIHSITDLCFYLSVAIICLLILYGKMDQSPFLAMGLILACLVLTRTHVRSWYYLWFWSMLWMSRQDLRYLLVSISLWATATLYSMMYIWWKFDPYFVAVLLIVDLCWYRFSFPEKSMNYPIAQSTQKRKRK